MIDPILIAELHEEHGLGWAEIARRLNNEGFKPKFASEWTRALVYRHYAYYFIPGNRTRVLIH